MHTNITPKSHRHLVAAPLFVLVLAAVIGNGAVASLQSYESDALPNGSALVSDEGVFHIEAGAYSVKSFAGAFHATLHGDALTVAALTAPVLVTRGDASVLVPVGTQWRGEGEITNHTFQPLPARFIREQHEALAALPSFDDSALPASRSTPPSGPSTFALLSAAQDRSRDAWAEEVLGYLRTAPEDVLSDPTYTDVLTSDRGAEVLAILLARLPEDSPLQPLFLAPLITHEDAGLLASVHPRFRDAAWTLPGLPTGEAQLLALPQSDTTSALAPETLVAWAQAVSALEEPTTFLDAAAPVLAAHALASDAQGYPARARMLADALLGLCEDFAVGLSPKSLASLEPLRDLDRVDISVRPEQEKAPAPAQVKEAPVVETLPPETIEARAYELMRSAGALFTVKTGFAAVGPNTAHVSDIIFGSPQGDRMYSFDLDVVAKQVKSVMLDDEELPYDLSLEAFTAWARK